MVVSTQRNQCYCKISLKIDEVGELSSKISLRDHSKSTLRANNIFFVAPFHFSYSLSLCCANPLPSCHSVKSDTKERLRLFWGYFWLLKQSCYLYSSRCYSAVIDTCSVMFKGVNFIFCFVVCLWEIKLLFKVKKCYGKVGRKSQKSLF